jgi:hypothetical protein
MTVLIAVVCLVAVVQLVCLLALIDQYRTLEFIRSELGLDDSPQPLDVPSTATSVGDLLAAPPEFNQHGLGLLLFVSTTCQTCREVVVRMKGSMPRAVAVVVSARSESEFESWVTAAGLQDHGSVTFDDGHRIAAELQLATTPAAFIVTPDRVLSGQTIPSYRQLQRQLQKLEQDPREHALTVPKGGKS